MRKMLIVLSVLGCCLRVNAQAQEIQQLKLDLEKLAQLKLMLSQLKQGYLTLQNGYAAVTKAAKGNFDLHKNYLDGLLEVSDQVKKSPALKRLVTNQDLMQTEYAGWLNKIRPLQLLTSKEMNEVQTIYQLQADYAKADWQQVQMILQSKNLRMSDGERLTAIGQLSDKSDQQLSAVRQLIKDKTSLLVERARKLQDVEGVKKLYGLH